jgi:hypothetical protein
MALKTYTGTGFAAYVFNNKAHIIGAVQAGQTYALNNAGAKVIFNATLDGLKADLTAKGYTILN